MALTGLGWLTYLSNPLVNYLSPYNLASGLLGDVSVFLWLLVMGVNVQRWEERASAAEIGIRGAAHPLDPTALPVKGRSV